MSLPAYEKLGVFYLGREFDLETESTRPDLVLYDSKDLTTHAVCVGMTGSGKTGLCLSLLEEAAIDHIPVIAIDPKGDLGNLLLTFPDLQGDDFLPWVDDSEALRHGKTTAEYAQQIADRWRKGLAEWDQTPDRIQLLKDSAEVAIYTPGSDAGLPLSVLQSFGAPSEAVLNDADAFRDRVMSAVSSLLALLKINADPISSREHILLSHIISNAWRQRRCLTVPQILHEIQQPPFEKVGFMDLETFFPQKERFGFALSVNNLLASPGFAAWMQGEPLNIERLLLTPAGKPRISVISIAHLNDDERMFIVTILLNELLSWVRSQPGTSTLRAILYMDEVFGYFPPTANPPSKLPMLTLLKQARAFGVGVVLATQNPVDLDYKGLANTGTWFLGRLQTERDKSRVLDGLESAAGSTGTRFNRAEMNRILSGLGQRRFLLHNVHDDHPIVFQSRWALSYLRGPLTRQQIATLMEPFKPPRPAGLPDAPFTNSSPSAPGFAGISSAEAQTTGSSRTPGPAAAAAQAGMRNAAAETASGSGASALPPSLSDAVLQRFVATSESLPSAARLVYRPAILGLAKLRYADTKSRLDFWQEQGFLVEEYEQAVVDVWDLGEQYTAPEIRFEAQPRAGAFFQELPGDLTRSTKFRTWQRMLREHIFREQHLTLWLHENPTLYSLPEESAAGFRLRVTQLLREQNDREVEQLKARYATKFSSARERVLRAEERVQREQSQFKERSYSSILSFGTSILGALMGRKVASAGNVSKAATAMRSAGRASSKKEDVQRAGERLEIEKQKYQELEDEFSAEVDKLNHAANPEDLTLQEYPVRPRKSDITIAEVSLCWLPWGEYPDGRAIPLFEIGTRSS